MDNLKLTRGTKELIKLAISATNAEDRNNRYKICEKIAEIVEGRYEGLNLEYQLERMGLQTTLQILNKVDLYFYKYHRE
ncbi:TPA: hypothetical protein N2D99_002354 [Clostridium botulinum]|nr:hypothetical protein [Clostridium botulinum]